MSLTTTQERALDFLRIFDERKALYDSANKAIETLNPDFPSLVNLIDPVLEASIVTMLDAVLGDEIASYYLYEAKHMTDGGLIIEADGRSLTIRTVDDVRAYVTGRSTPPAGTEG